MIYNMKIQSSRATPIVDCTEGEGFQRWDNSRPHEPAKNHPIG